MGVRRSHTGRTAAVLPRGTRRPPAASTLLLSFALLVALSTGTAQGFAPHDAAPDRAPAASSSAAGSLSTASGDLAADIAGLSVASTQTTISVARGPQLAPLPPMRHARPKRPAVAANQDGTSRADLTGLAAVPPDNGSGAIGPLVDDGAGVAFITHASRSSRTRGQPASDC